MIRPCLVEQMLFIGKPPKGIISHTWQFWNINISKPTYISSQEMIKSFNFLSSSIFFTIYSLYWSPCRIDKKSNYSWVIGESKYKNTRFCCFCLICRNLRALWDDQMDQKYAVGGTKLISRTGGAGYISDGNISSFHNVSFRGSSAFPVVDT